MKSERLLSLDILRGITVAGMILVNNPGSWEHVYAPLRHAEWNGLTPTDLVFPFFMFVMGVSMSLSFGKFGYRLTPVFAWKLVRRTLILFALGVSFSWFSLFLSRLLAEGAEFSWQDICFPLGDIRILGVLQRLALTYFLGSLLIVSVPERRFLPWIAGGILVVYYAVLSFGNGFSLSESNIIAVVDRALWGEAHLYHEGLPGGGRIAFDPEGLLSTIPGIAHVVLGFFCGEIVRRKVTLDEKMVQLSVVGISLLFAGFLLSYGCPVNKKVWSPTYVLVTCGLAYLFLVLLLWIVDVRKVKGWSVPFQAFGTNPLFIYVVATLLAIVLDVTGLQSSCYHAWLRVVPVPEFASALYALSYILLNGLLVYGLFKKRIFIKI